ncbi:shikimate dehydrogenase [uncultured Tenacibaculum sp.]|uniref:shikimate dehydrogenase family protein n=1 Tax=uncultured Tenacibaculum sp. TaxID=174713 RepID=UPI002618A1F2|nr:shikimate dehydrogenase [uncultured Tenacibaculum sp.]
MEEKINKKLFGLLGKNISYSFSRGYFKEKFELLNLDNHKYVNFDIDVINQFDDIIQENKSTLSGMNVTIPYKEEVMPFLDKLDKKARKIGAVNTIKITKKGKLKGYNTDYYGFKKSLEPLLNKKHKKALILGTGGASKAIAFALKKLDITYKFVSRKGSGENMLNYSEIDQETIEESLLIINCTPLGTSPDIDKKPDIPYQFLGADHILYDLIYNPSETAFLKAGKEKGATIKNGLQMLELQAEKAWKIWN